MWGIFGKLFGSSAAGEKIIDGVSNGIDKLWYTKEEKAEDQAKREERADAMRVKGYEVYMSWLESTTGSRIARRVIAIMITGIWALEHVSAIVLRTASVFVDEPTKWAQAAEMLSQTAYDNNSLVGVVLLFYFGGPVGIEGVKGLVSKWVDKGNNVQVK
jgi:hypothetical protein